MGGSPIFYLCPMQSNDGFSMMDLPTRLEPVLAGLGYELVMLERAGRGLVRIFIDKPGGITIDDCVTVSNHLTHLFTVENIDYDRLEVSSPGLDRPLVKPQDYARFAGEQITLKLRVPMDNRRRLSGQLVGLEENAVKLIVDGTEVSVDLRNVDAARLKPMV
ncbi:MAG: ribosome maturation factor RimP [Hydrogenophilales bacterium 17-64-11]|nr:MAG: ribosome maturation factor RimP [Hydrogenophilales bacterium 17-64-11]